MSRFLPAAVESVVNQRYGNLELIIVDDGSDRAVDREQWSVEKTPVKLVEIKHGGKAKAVNRGLQAATGEYIAILDADDRLPEDSLCRRVETLEQNRADLSMGSFQVCYDDKIQTERPISKFCGQPNAELSRSLLTDIISPFHQNAMLFSRQLLRRTGEMDPRMLRGQDKDFAVRLLRESKKTVFVEDPVYIYNRYDRTFSTRMYNRLMGMRYKLVVVHRHTKGWRRVVYLVWNALIEGAKLIHDFFWVYKK